MSRRGAVVALIAVGGLVVADAQRPQRDDQPVGVNYLKLQQILAIEDARAPLERDRLMLFDAASQPTPPKPNPKVRREDLSDHYPAAAVRALGRIERQDLLSSLMSLFASGRPEIRAAAAPGLFLTVRAAPRTDMPDPQIAAVVDGLLERGPGEWAMLARLPMWSSEQTAALEERLLVPLRVQFPVDLRHAAAARGVEAMARYHRRLYTPTEETITHLRRVATADDPSGRSEPWQINAMAALIATGHLDEATLDSALADTNPEVRRLAALALSGTGLQIDPAKRTAFTRLALNDRSPMVRYEGIRAWARREAQADGCAPLVHALTDPSLHVVLAAIDALGDQCQEDESIADIMVADLRAPPTVGSWHREAHTLVACAKRAPDRAAISMQAFARHPVWQVRMYAARAAGVMKDADTLDRLVYDSDDNVRNAALPLFRVLRGAASDAAVSSALARTDYQLVRTAASLVKGAAPSRELVDGLVRALQRITLEKKETSRDTRMALLERIAELGNANIESALKPFGRDFDPVVAAEAARVFERLTGRPLPVEPRLLPRQPVPNAGEITEFMEAWVYLENGQHFRIELASHRDTAPLAYARFVRLARAGYYNGLTFHRVVPNYIVQGGSPGANEYAGDGPFMRDEFSTTWMSRGVVGISTRGRDTGDAQIFINLVDNPRLDFDYTVLGDVGGSEDLKALDTIVEGTKIERIEIRRRVPR